MPYTLNKFEDSKELATALAEAIANRLSNSIKQNGRASAAFSGGNTPRQMFNALSKQKLDWGKVDLLLVDERCVPADNSRSNEKLLRENLMVGHAIVASYVSIRDKKAMAGFSKLDVAVLGMGTDGHTASFFPGGDTLSEATDPNSKVSVIEISAPGAEEPRVTLTLPVLTAASNLYLHIEGEEKRTVLDAALEEGPADDLPIRHVLRHPSVNLEVYWSP